MGAITNTEKVAVYTHIMDINTTWCIPPNKSTQATIVAFGAIIDT